MDAMQVQAMAAASQRMRAGERIRIAAALKRLDADEYGSCVQCGEAIAPARLETDPTLATCVKCASGGGR
jgi:DnaK suppressor protein